jgi:heat shock factor-binding protein 1
VAAGGNAGDPQNAQDLTLFVQQLLQQMQGRFQTMSDTIIGRIDEMGSRIDDLEKSIAELMQQAGVDEQAAARGGAADEAGKSTG